MATPNQHPAQRLTLIGFVALLAVLPLIWPGLGGTSSDHLVKRSVLYAIAFSICIFWLWLPRHKRQSSPLVLPALLYVVWNVISLIWAMNPFTGWVEALQLMVMFILFFVFINFNLIHRLPLLAGAASAGGFVVSIIGITQYHGIGFNDILSVGLPSSTFIFRNLAAAYLLGAIPLSFFVLLREHQKSRAIFWILSLSVMLLYLFYTRTRGAWLSFAGALVLASICLVFFPALRQQCLQSLARHWSVSLTRWATIVCALFLIGGAMRPAQTSSNVIQQFDEKKSSASAAITSLVAPGSDRGRFIMWQYTLSMLKDHPLLGVGLDNWEYVYPVYDHGKKITADSEPVRPHNDLLWIASELGLIGLGLYIFLLYKAADIAIYQIKQASSDLPAFIALIGLAALVGYSMFSFPREQPTPALFFWLFLAILAATQTRPQNTVPIVPILSAVTCICALYLTTRNITFDIAYLRARTLEQHNLIPQANTEITRATNAGPFDHRALFLKAQYLQKMGKNAQATAAYLRALKSHPNYAHSHHNLGGTYAAQKAFNKAIASYKQAIALRPAYIQAHLHLGNAYAATNQVYLAIESFGNATTIAPKFAEAHTNLGALYLRQQKFKQAINSFQKAIQLQPTNAQAHNNLAYAYEQTGHIQEAIAAYEILLKYWKGDPAYRETVQQHIQDLHHQNKSN